MENAEVAQENLHHLDVAEVAKRVRKAIRQKQKEGELPPGKFSVRIDRYSMGCSLDVKGEDLEVGMLNLEGLLLDEEEPERRFDYHRPKYLSEAGQCVQDVLDGIVNPYHRDESDSSIDYFDRNFSKHVEVCGSDQQSKERDRARAVLAQLPRLKPDVSGLDPKEAAAVLSRAAAARELRRQALSQMSSDPLGLDERVDAFRQRAEADEVIVLCRNLMPEMFAEEIQ